MKKHSSSDMLRERLRRCEPQPWSGVGYRCASVAFANRDDLLTGGGAKIHGARWNPPNSVNSLYVSLDMVTALEETVAVQRYFAIPLEHALPMVLVAVQIKLQKVLLLTDASIRRTLQISKEQLVSEDWRAANAHSEETLSQALGRVAWHEQWEAILVPSSARCLGKNLVIFPGNLQFPDSYLLIINREQLPAKTDTPH